MQVLKLILKNWCQINIKDMKSKMESEIKLALNYFKQFIEASMTEVDESQCHIW